MPQVAVGTTGVEALKQNGARRSMLLQNIGTTGLFLDTMKPTEITTSNAAIKLTAGSAFVLNVKDDGKGRILDQWSCIGDAASGTLAAFESWDVEGSTEELRQLLFELIALAKKLGPA